MALASFVAVSAAGLSNAAAADLPVKAPRVAPLYSWTGFYAGVNGGGAWAQSGGSITAVTAGLVGVPDAGLPRNYGIKSSGGFGGIQAGYNYQITNYLLGVEADIQDGKVSGSASSAFAGIPGLIAASVNSASSKMTWFGTLRGRLGITFDRALIYATGGLAVAHVNDTVINNFDTPVNLYGNSSVTKAGWTAGGGFEYAVANDWSLKAEYLYMDLGSNSVTATDPVNLPGAFVIYSFNHRYNLARAGLSHRF